MLMPSSMIRTTKVNVRDDGQDSDAWHTPLEQIQPPQNNIANLLEVGIRSPEEKVHGTVHHEELVPFLADFLSSRIRTFEDEKVPVPVFGRPVHPVDTHCPHVLPDVTSHVSRLIHERLQHARFTGLAVAKQEEAQRLIDHAVLQAGAQELHGFVSALLSHFHGRRGQGGAICAHKLREAGDVAERLSWQRFQVRVRPQHQALDAARLQQTRRVSRDDPGAQLTGQHAYCLVLESPDGR